MKRMFIAVMVLLLFLMAGVQTQKVNAGWTDIWCVGGTSTQICIDSSGNLVPITAGGQNLGNDTYRFGTVSILDLSLSFGISAATATFSGAVGAATLDTGQGANELFDMDQNVLATSDPTFADLTVTYGIDVATVIATGLIEGVTLNTGQGANELYAMDQAVQTTDDPTFEDLTVTYGLDVATVIATGLLEAVTVNTGQGANELYAMDQDVQQADSPTFSHLTLTFGVEAVTGTFTGALSGVTINTGLGAFEIGQDLDIGDSVTFAGISGTTGDFSSTLNVDGDVNLGAPGYKSTFTASSGDVSMPRMLTVSSTVFLGHVTTQSEIAGDLQVSGYFYSLGQISTEADFWGGGATFLGDMHIGTDATGITSTCTATTGDQAWSGDLSAVEATFSGNVDVDGNLEIGNDSFVSTFTATTGLFTPHRFVLPSHATPYASVTPLVVGEVIRDSTADEICRSTIAAVGGWVLFVDSGTVCSN